MTPPLKTLKPQWSKAKPVLIHHFHKKSTQVLLLIQSHLSEEYFVKEINRRKDKDQWLLKTLTKSSSMILIIRFSLFSISFAGTQAWQRQCKLISIWIEINWIDRKLFGFVNPPFWWPAQGGLQTWDSLLSEDLSYLQCRFYTSNWFYLMISHLSVKIQLALVCVALSVFIEVKVPFGCIWCWVPTLTSTKLALAHVPLSNLPRRHKFPW